MITLRHAAAALAALPILVACDDTSAPRNPESRALKRVDAAAHLISHDYPSIQFPSGIANDGIPGNLYVSTVTGFRETHIIDPTTNTIVGTQPGSANPRDIVWAWGRGFFHSDEARYVQLNTFSGPIQEPIPWRGGGIAHWRDTLYVGDQDTDSILVMTWSTFPFPHLIVRKFPTPTRNEGLVADTTDVIASTATLWSIGQTDGFMTEIDLQGNFIRRCNTPYTPGPFGLGGITLLRDTFFLAYPIGGDPFAGTRVTRIARSELVCGGVADTIDIEPRHVQNRVNPRSGGTVDVAVLSNSLRDARTLITATVRFGRTGTEASPLSATITDVNGDGDLDVVFEFRTSHTGIVCGDTSARLRAIATSGPAFDASDSIVTIGCGRP
jgi:hypothetical protein